MLGLTAENWSVAADMATVAGVVAAFLGALAAVLQLTSSRALQREIHAKQIYAQLLRMSFEHPALAEPEPGAVTLPGSDPKYVWFVSNLLNALDEILVTVPGREWRNLARMLLGYHRVYLASDKFRVAEYGTYSQELRRLLDEIVSNSSSERFADQEPILREAS